MSFLAASADTMVFELWPTPMKKEVQRLQGDDDYAGWELFPASLQGMAEWSDIYQDPEWKDKSRDHILIYKNIMDTKPNTVYPVAIRVQGLCVNFDLKDLETGLGGHEEVWKATIHSLNLVYEYVSWCLHLPAQGIPYKKELYFQRHAFIKRDKPCDSKTPTLSTTQDPEGKYLRVQDNWSIVHPLTIADLTSMGKILPMDAVLLTQGDFVDVGAELDFVKMKLDENIMSWKCTSTPPPQERATKKTHTTLAFDEE
ncbi:hypothetical protein F4604DRAFT_1680127 [Suillus subluteus]|nr:hypothetical protein F4604DRAFT_1680127 [Suillus subluteus]